MTSAELVRSRKYKPEQVERALLTLAINGGNTVRASKQAGIPQKTLHNWLTDTYADRYREICRDHGHEIEANIINQAREIAVEAAHVERTALDVTMTALLAGETKAASEASTVFRNTGTGKGINVDKALILEGRPSVITEHRSPEDIVTALARLAPKSVPNTNTIDSTATDLNDALAPIG